MAPPAPLQRSASRFARLGQRAALLWLFAAGCGMGTDSPAGANTAFYTSGLPRCDASLLHPRITVGASDVLPGRSIVYVDGVMACMDESAKVDQLISQIEGREASGLRR